jgi:uncharacterized protein YkwD
VAGDTGELEIAAAQPAGAGAPSRARDRLTPAFHAALAVMLAACVLAVTPRGAAATSPTDVRALVMGWLNADRAAAGLVAYREWTAVDDLAADRAAKIAASDTLSHDAAGGNVGDALDARGIPWSWYGEALGMIPAWGATFARQVYDQWMASAPHHDILMSNVDNYVGIGVVEGADGSTWMSLIATQSPDHTRPVATNGTLTRSGTSITVRWRGSDPALQTLTAGIRSFDVQVRRDDGGWWTWLDNTTRTSAVIANRQHRHAYWFRVQATDRRGNLSAWTAPIRMWVP